MTPVDAIDYVSPEFLFSLALTLIISVFSLKGGLLALICLMFSFTVARKWNLTAAAASFVGGCAGISAGLLISIAL